MKSISDKHEDILAKIGSIIAAGILDAGGRNASIGLRSRGGAYRLSAIVGLAVFTQYWRAQPKGPRPAARCCSRRNTTRGALPAQLRSLFCALN